MNDILGPATHEQHQMYVELGYCPSIHDSRAWCCQRAGHADKHFALRVISAKQFVRGLEWD